MLGEDASRKFYQYYVNILVTTFASHDHKRETIDQFTFTTK
jgi:hypothetical protein